jgi:hypothetical protein
MPRDEFKDDVNLRFGYAQIEVNRQTRDLKDYTDEGFGAVRRSLDQFREEFRDTLSGLHTEIDRRFMEAKDEVGTARTAQQRAIDAALISAEKAVDRANDASEKRFDAVNEFRGQQRDIISGFLSRVEYEAQHRGLVDTVAQLRNDLTELTGVVVPRAENESWRAQNTQRITDMNSSLTERISSMDQRLTSRLDTMAGQDTGESNSKSEHRLDISQIVQVLAVVISIAAIITVIILH